MYAIIRTGGRQYRAEVGAILDVDLLPYEANQTFDITDVLLVGDESSTVIGQPTVEGATVKVTVLDMIKGEKIRVFHYRQRTNYTKMMGHRQKYTRIRVDAITV